MANITLNSMSLFIAHLITSAAAYRNETKKTWLVFPVFHGTFVLRTFLEGRNTLKYVVQRSNLPSFLIPTFIHFLSLQYWQ